MSPAGFSGSSSVVWYVNIAGRISNANASGTGHLRPVIIMTADIQISDGDGTINSPFVVE